MGGNGSRPINQNQPIHPSFIKLVKQLQPPPPPPPPPPRLSANQIIEKDGSPQRPYDNTGADSSTSTQGFTNIFNYNNFGAYNNNMQNLEGFEIADKTNVLYKQISEFNEKYMRFVHCSNPDVNGDCGPTESADLIGQLGNLYKSINGNDGTIPDVQRLIDNIPDKTTYGTYDATYNDIIRKNNIMLNMRREMDTKLKELYLTEDSIANSYKQKYDSTIYSHILLSALATSLLYYIFKNV